VHFDATLSVLPPRWPLQAPRYVDHTPPTQSTSHELRDPSAYPDENALLFTHRLMRVQEGLLCLLKVPPSGFGYPLDGLRRPHPGGPLSAPNTPGFRPSELCSFPEIEEPSRILPSALTLPYETAWASYRRFSGLLSPEKPCPFLPPDGLDRVGTKLLS
jgi:hypothetical protein